MMKIKVVILCLLFCFLPFSTTFCAKQPCLKLSTTNFDLGTLMPSESVIDSVAIENTGSGILEISARSTCDCLDILSTNEKIAPGDTGFIVFIYYAPDSAQVDAKSIIISTNDKLQKNVRINLTANILQQKVQISDSSFAILPINGLPPQESARCITNFVTLAQRGLSVKLVNGQQLLHNVAKDKYYGIIPTEKIIRKWAINLGIRWTLIGTVFPAKTDTLDIVVFLIDALSEFPVELRMKSTASNIAEALVNNLKDVFKNWKQYSHQAFMQGFARKYEQKRKDLIGSRLPIVDFEDLFSGEKISSKNTKGKVLLMHFFSVDCKHCEEEIEWLSKLDTVSMPDLLIWGITVDTDKPDSARTFYRARNLPYRILIPSDEQLKKLSRIYSGATPQTIIVDKNGIVKEFMMGFNEKLTKNLEAKLRELTAEQ